MENGRPVIANSLGNVPSFANTQQKWEDPAPYNSGSPAAQTPQTQQNALKEPSLILVRSVTQGQVAIEPKLNTGDDGAPRLELKPRDRTYPAAASRRRLCCQPVVVHKRQY